VKFFKPILGIVLVIVGFIGWLLPIIPGAPLFFIGLYFCLSWHPKGRVLAKSFETKFKNLAVRLNLWSKSPQDITKKLFD
jgi:hypothetical protein